MTLDEAIKHEEEFKAVTLEECRRVEEHRQLAEWLKDYQRLLGEQHVDDAKKHFEIICKLSQAYGMPYSFVEEKIKETEKALIEAYPQPKMGRWEYVQYDKTSIGNWHCSKCDRIVFLLNSQKYDETPLYNYCPWCGEKKKEAEE